MKRELQDLQDFLQTAAEGGRLSEQIYVGACKRIKNVYDASETPRTHIVEQVVIEYGLCNPFSLMTAPAEVNIFDEDFVERLFEEFVCTVPTADERAEWIDKICEVYFDVDDVPAHCTDVAATIASTMIQVMPECCKVVMDRLTDELCIDPTELFSVQLVIILAQTAPILATYFYHEGECIAEDGWATDAELRALRARLEKYRKQQDSR